MPRKQSRDVEKRYTTGQFVAKLRRFADALESGQRFRIQIAGERVTVPADAVFTVEHEREGGMEEIEFQIKWAGDRS
jgi:amphi-Trp domain-containing protein